MRIIQAPRLLSLTLLATLCASGSGQTPPANMPEAPAPQAAPAPPASAPPPSAIAPLTPQEKSARQLGPRPDQTPAQAAEALRISKLAIINGAPYDQPSVKDTLLDYANDTYLLPALARTSVRALYAQARGKPTGWGTDFPGFMQRFGSSYAVTAINGNVRLAFELFLEEDLRYLPCHGCSIKRKIENSLLAEVTARHSVDGHRFFTLTPTIADFSGPIIAHSYWYPNGFDPLAGVIAARTVFATRIGQHLFQEFVLERRHKYPHVDR